MFFSKNKESENGFGNLAPRFKYTPPKILIAEDEADLREVLDDKLTEEGFQTLQAVDGRETIDKALSQHPDLILLDLYMPNTSGFDVMSKLIDDPWGKTTKIIVLTNRGDLTTKRKVYDLKQVTYLIKAEVGLDELVDAIKNKLKEYSEVDDSLPI